MILEENLQIGVIKEYDVAVCGGGVAGIAAALAAARQGKKTVLFEKQYMLGGLGTAGLITIYLPLCDGYGHQVSFGIAEELLRLSISEGAEDLFPDNWLNKEGSRTEKDQRFKVRYNAQVFAILAEQLLIDEGVDILYGTYVVGVHKDADKITHLITENKSGRCAYKVKSVVDSTGDCDIAHFAGTPTDVFHRGNMLASWYYSVGSKGYELHQLGCCDIADEEKTSQNKVVRINNRRFAGLEGKEISEMVSLSHKSVLSDFLKRKNKDPEYWPVTIASVPQLRMTRKIVGEYELSDKEEHKFFEDSIGMISDWRKRGPVYEVPFRTLYNHNVKNLITAGRCTSVDENMWDIMRVIPCCAVTGQAAGTAAAMTDDFSSLDVNDLQEKLKSACVVLHEKDIVK